MASNLPASKSGLYADPREDWLALHSEDVIDPARRIVDPHHHLWDRGGQRYLIDELAADIASLYKAMGGFATNGVNMTKLESYMVDGSFAATQFYADVQGHPKHRALELALEELEFVSQPKSLKILGVYPAHRFREKFT